MKRLAPALLLVAGGVHAAPPDVEFYGGIGTGYTTIKVDQQPLVINGQSGTSTFSRNLSGTTLPIWEYLGTRIGPYAGLETGFVKFGTLNDATVPLQPPYDSQNNSVKSYGYTLSLVGYYPLDNQLEVYGKVGAIRWHSKIAQNGSQFATNDKGDDLAYGFGIDLHSAGRLHLRVEAAGYDMAFANEYWTYTMSILYSMPLEDFR